MISWDITAHVDLLTVFTKSSLGMGYIGIETSSMIMYEQPLHDGLVAPSFPSSVNINNNNNNNNMTASVNNINNNNNNNLSQHSNNSWTLHYDIYNFQFNESSSTTSVSQSTSLYLVSPYTKSNHMDTFVKLTSDIQKFQIWLKLKLQMKMPNPLFTVLFDDDIMRMYESLFSNLIKVCFVG